MGLPFCLSKPSRRFWGLFMFEGHWDGEISSTGPASAQMKQGGGKGGRTADHISSKTGLFLGWKKVREGMLLLEKYGWRQERPAVPGGLGRPLLASLGSHLEDSKNH